MCDELVWDEMRNGDRVQSVEALPEREQVKLVLIGSIAGVKEQIHKLHVLGFADAGDWSRLVSVPGEAVVMSVLVQYRKR
jgi:ACT domain-containing protein